MDDLTNFVHLQPTVSCTAASTAKHLLRWCRTLRVLEVWVSDTSSHFNKRVMKTLEGALNAVLRWLIHPGLTALVRG